MARWDDIEKALVAGMRDAGVSPRVATRVPPDVETLPAFVRLARGPGSDDLVTDAPLIDIESFAQTYGDSADLAEDVRQYMHSLSGRKVAGVLIDRVRTATGPAHVDYRNPDTVRFVASYRLEYRQSHN